VLDVVRRATTKTAGTVKTAVVDRIALTIFVMAASVSTETAGRFNATFATVMVVGGSVCPATIGAKLTRSQVARISCVDK